jgi:hypothetical protein
MVTFATKTSTILPNTTIQPKPNHKKNPILTIKNPSKTSIIVSNKLHMNERPIF